MNWSRIGHKLYVSLLILLLVVAVARTAYTFAISFHDSRLESLLQPECRPSTYEQAITKVSSQGKTLQDLTVEELLAIRHFAPGGENKISDEATKFLPCPTPQEYWGSITYRIRDWDFFLQSFVWFIPVLLIFAANKWLRWLAT